MYGSKKSVSIILVWAVIALVATAIQIPFAYADGQEPAVPALIVIAIADSAAPPQQRGYHAREYQLSPLTTQLLATLERDYALRKIDGWPMRVLEKYCAVMAVADGVDVDTLLQRLQHDARVSLAQHLQTFEIRGDQASVTAYNDPYFSQQYGKFADTIVQLHRRTTGRNVHIAVIDTGADTRHADLHKLQSRDFVDASADADRELHGTAVAGIIAASANNGVGIVGLAPDAKVIMLRACWQLAAGNISARCNTLTLARALSFAIEVESDIINLSLGGPDDPLLTQLVHVALARGILVVAARDKRDIFPATIPGVLAVDAASGDDNELIARAIPATNEIIASASEVLSTSPGGHYDFFSGSSMAAARVTGLAALMKQEQKKLTSQQLLESLDRWLSNAANIASSR